MNEPTTRPASMRDVLTLIDALNQKNVEYMLIGGFSMIVHGFSRSTRDIDMLVPKSVENGEKIKEVLLLLPDKAAKEIDPAWFSEGENIRVSDEYVVDIMLNANGETFESLRPYMEFRNINGISVPIASMEGLLKTKMTGRAKDIPDRIFLERHLSYQLAVSGRKQMNLKEK